MTNYSINPTYYRITWDQTSPTDYTGLSGTRAGGLDSTTAWAYNRKVSVTGSSSITSTVMADGDKLVINNESIEFSSSDTLADIIARINVSSLLTRVIAHNGVGSTYVTLTNAAGFEGTIINVEEGNGALAKLGIVAGHYNEAPCEVGTSFTTFTNGDTFEINGITITMTSAVGLTQAGAVAAINALTEAHGVVATRAADKIQLAGINGHAWSTSGSNATKLGFPAGLYGGNPLDLASSTAKERAYLRWLIVINQLEMFATPFMVADHFGTGSFDGSEELTTFSFTVGYERPDYLRTVATADEPDAGIELTGAAAIKRAVARALTGTLTLNAKLWDPTLEARNDYAVRPNPFRQVELTADGFDTIANMASIEGNITVTVIALS